MSNKGNPNQAIFTRVFNAPRAGMDQGWSGIFDGLNAYLWRAAK